MAGAATRLQRFRSRRGVRLPGREYGRRDVGVSHVALRTTGQGGGTARRSPELCASAMTTWLRDGFKTASPNAGQTMACAAGALGVRLEKEGHYVLGAHSRLPAASDIGRARRLVARAIWVAAALALLARIRD